VARLARRLAGQAPVPVPGPEIHAVRVRPVGTWRRPCARRRHPGAAAHRDDALWRRLAAGAGKGYRGAGSNPAPGRGGLEGERRADPGGMPSGRGRGPAWSRPRSSRCVPDRHRVSARRLAGCMRAPSGAGSGMW